MRKRGVSAIVATVLLVLIVSVAVGIIYTMILPMFADISEFEYADLDLGIALEGYTVYDPQEGISFVQVRRGNDDLELAGLKIIFEVDGVSDDSTSYNVPAEDVPGPNQKKTYVFLVREDGIENPDSVSVVPLFLKAGKTVRGSVSSKIKLPLGTLDPEDVSRARDLARNYHPEGYYDSWIPLTSCSVLNVEGGRYYFDGDILTSGNDACLNIVANDVRIDMRGHNLIKTPDFWSNLVNSQGYDDVQIYGGRIAGEGSMFVVQDGQDVVIRDIILDGGFYLSMELRDLENGLFQNLTFINGAYLGVSGSLGVLENSHFEDILVSDCSLGLAIALSYLSGNTFQNLSVYNSAEGLSISSASDNNQFSGIVVDGTTSGHAFTFGGSNNQFNNLILKDSSNDGLRFTGGVGNTFENFEISDNHDKGISLRSNANNNIFRNGVIRDNGAVLRGTVYIIDSSGNIFENVDVSDNAGYGFYIRAPNVDSNSFNNLKMCGNDAANFYLLGTSTQFYGGVESSIIQENLAVTQACP